MAEKVVFPSFRSENFGSFDMRQLVSALEYRFTSIETELTETTAASGGPFAPLVHSHVEADIADLRPYLLSISSESIFDLADVSGAPAVNNVLRWDGSGFVTSSIGASINLNDLANVIVPAPDDGDLLSFSSSSGGWVATPASATFNTDLTGQAEYDLLYNEGGTTWHDTAGDLIWNPDFDYLQLANAHSINWRDSGFITKQLLEFTSGNVFEVGHDSHVTQLKGSFVQTNDAFRVYDSGNTDYGEQSHDGTDYNWAFTNTTDLNITGLTAINAGGVDVDFDAITATSYGGIDEGDLLDKSATETVAGDWTFSGTLVIPEAAVTDHEGAINHDALTNFVADEHIDWTVDAGVDIAAANISEASVTQHEAAITVTESQISDLGSYLENVVEDATPQLGGELLSNGQDVTMADNDRIHFGTAGASDSSIYFNGTDLLLDGTGATWLRFDNFVSGALFLDGAQVRIYDSTNSDYVNFNHNGTNFTLSATSTDNIDFISVTNNVRIRDGAGLVIYDSTDSDYARFAHSGANFSTDFINTGAWVIDGLSVGVQFRDSGATKFYVNYFDNHVEVRDGYEFLIRDSSDADSASFRHTGTDFVTDFANTTDWDIAGLSGGVIIDDANLAIASTGDKRLFDASVAQGSGASGDGWIRIATANASSGRGGCTLWVSAAGGTAAPDPIHMSISGTYGVSVPVVTILSRQQGSITNIRAGYDTTDNKKYIDIQVNNADAATYYVQVTGFNFSSTGWQAEWTTSPSPATPSSVYEIELNNVISSQDLSFGVFNGQHDSYMAFYEGSMILESADNDAAIYLKADSANTFESANAFIRFEQDGNALNSVIGTTGAADIDAQGGTFTGMTNNGFAIHHNHTGGSIGLGVNNNLALRIDDSDDITMPLDNQELRFGVGNDLQIYSNGSTGVIENQNQSCGITISSVVNARADNPVPLRVNDTTSSSTNSRIQFEQEGAPVGYVGFVSGNMYFRSLNHGANVIIRGEDAGGTTQDFLRGDPDTQEVQLNAGATDVFFTQDHNDSGNTSGARVKAHNSGYRDVGFNELDLFNDDTSDTLEANHSGCINVKDTTTALTLTLAASGDTDFPLEHVTHVANAGSSGNYTISEGSGTTLFYLDPGTGLTDTAGGCTIGPGGVATIWRRSTTVYWIWGSEITP